MITHKKRHWKIGAACLAVLGMGGGIARAEIVYDNSYSSEGVFYQATWEYGDEVNLVGSARTVVDFRFEYYAEFTPSGAQTCRLRFYANDGAGQPGYKAPGTVLFDSGPFPIQPGFNTKVLSGLSVQVPDRFTWTVQFAGVQGFAGSRAGLTFFDPPIAGSSFNDFWQNPPDTSTPPNYTWALYHFPPPQVANFSARVTAIPDPGVNLQSQTQLTNGLFVLNLTGNPGRDFVLQASTNQANWVDLSTNTLTSSPMSLLDDHALVFNPIFYRVFTLPESSIHLLSPAELTNRNFKLFYDGPIGRHVQIEVSTNLTDWTILAVKTLVGEPVAFVDNNASSIASGLYRGTLLSEPVNSIGANFALTNGQFLVPLSGRPGHDFIVHASTDLQVWTILATNTFTFSGGYAEFIEPAATNRAHRFYWFEALP